jgi:heme exporter protein D
MDALTEFLHMGGYAFYVWTAYAITTVVLVLNVFIPLRDASAQLRRLQRSLADNDCNQSP